MSQVSSLISKYPHSKKVNVSVGSSATVARSERKKHLHIMREAAHMRFQRLFSEALYHSKVV